MRIRDLDSVGRHWALRGVAGYCADTAGNMLSCPLLTRHIAQPAEWQKTKIFDRSGRVTAAKTRFHNGEWNLPYGRHPGTAISTEQITLKPPTDHSRGVRLGSFTLIRDIVDDELEQAFAGKKSAEQALMSADARGNRLLRQFGRDNPWCPLRFDAGDPQRSDARGVGRCRFLHHI